MKRSLLAAGAAAVLALGLFSPVAFADEATGPDTAACEAASTALAEAPTEVENPDLAALQAAVQTALDAEIPSPVNPGDVDRLDALKAKADDGNETAIKKVALIEAHLDAVEAAQSDLDAAPETVANPALDGLAADKAEACEIPEGEEPPAGNETPDEQGSEDSTDSDSSSTETSTENQAGSSDRGPAGGLTINLDYGNDPVNTGVASSVPVGSVDTGA